MAKRYKRLKCGNYVRDCLYSCPEPRDTPVTRAAKSRATSMAQQRVNQNNSKIKLAMLVGGNFGPNDLLVTPTFSPEHLPANYAELQEKVRKFFDLLRKVRQKQGHEMKYIYAPHHTEKVRWHIHSLINAVSPRDWEAIKSLWPWGDVHIKRMQDAAYSTPDAMAGYLISGWSDRPNSARAWRSSTNLNKTVVTAYREHDQAARLELPVGCELCEADSWVTPYGSYEYLSFFCRSKPTDGSNEVDAARAGSLELIVRGTL